MGAAVFLLVLLVGPTVYADIFLPESGFPVYIPKSPRRPIIMVWPSVMNPAVANAIAEQVNQTYRGSEYLEIQCDKRSEYKANKLTTHEVNEELDVFEEAQRAPKFWSVLVPELIAWLSSAAIECGFYTIFKEIRDDIYRFIDSNRSKWIKALGKLVHTLVEVIAVIHHKTEMFAHGLDFAHLNWLEDWVESYEYWFKKYSNALEHFQKIILNSLDIVTAWLYDYIAEHTKDSTWELSNDPAIVCALENFDMVPAVGWDHLLVNVENKVKVMAATFVTCKVKSGCVYDRTIDIYTGEKDRHWFVRIPSPLRCVHHCTALPDVPSFPVPFYPATLYKVFAYAYAYMTTVVGHDLHCLINRTHFHGNEVYTLCYPQVVEKYITDRQYNICKSDECAKACCKPLTLRPRAYPHCENVTTLLSITDRRIRNLKRIQLTKRYPNP